MVQLRMKAKHQMVAAVLKAWKMPEVLPVQHHQEEMDQRLLALVVQL
jgi:hypothetical protein